MNYLLELTNDEQCYKEYPVQKVGIKSQYEQCMNENHSTCNGSCRSALTSVMTYNQSSLGRTTIIEPSIIHQLW